MLFRPSYCANCGEKIEREEWHLWTSRRFCAVCESEYKGQDLLPRFITGAGILALMVGVGGYFRTGPSVTDPAVRQLKGGPEKAAAVNPPPSASISPNGGSLAPMSPPPANVPPQVSRQPSSMQPLRSAAGEKNSGETATYFCGAQTKKGTPCTRRVKGNIRCYQHVGMPAMLPAEKLRAG
jgi:hypothetical protein